MSRPRAHRTLAVLVLLVGLGVYGVSRSSMAPAAIAAAVPERHPQNVWAPCNRNANNDKPSTFTPLSDAEAASLVTREPEVRPFNARPYSINRKSYPAANDYN